MFGEEKTGKMFNVHWLLFHILLSHFTSFNTTPLILLVKITLIRKCESVKGDQFRWANASVQVGRRCPGPKSIPFYNSSTDTAFTSSKSPMETPDVCGKSVES